MISPAKKNPMEKTSIKIDQRGIGKLTSHHNSLRRITRFSIQFHYAESLEARREQNLNEAFGVTGNAFSVTGNAFSVTGMIYCILLS